MTTHLVKRGGRYYIRRRIPTDLLDQFEGKKEVQQALGTSDPKEAARLVRKVGAEIDDRFEAVRITRTAIQKAQRPPAVRYDRSLSLEAEEVERRDDDESNEDQQVAEHDAIEKKQAEYSLLTALIRDTVAAQIGAFLPFSAAPAPVAHPAPAKPVAPASVASNGTRSFSALIAKWAAERKPTAATQATMRRAIERFRNTVGDLQVTQVTKGHVVAFKDALLAEGLTPKNTNYQLAQVKSLLQYAAGQDWITTSPALGVQVEGKSETGPARIAFPETALKSIFSSPIYTEGLRPPAGAGESVYWLPLLALYTGARVEELAQLAPGDVREESYRDAAGKEKRCWVMLITNEGEGQRLKNSGSRRRIPVHGELLARGFVKYVQSRKGEALVFPLKENKAGRKAALWSVWWHAQLREKWGVTDKRLVFHSFRHTFKDVCRECGIDKGVRDALQGHTEKGAAGGYGGEFYPLRPMVEAMNRYKVHGVKLP